MIKNPPLITIGMPVYNGEPYIKEAIDSFISQTYKNFRLIISDNASTDKTQEICLNYQAKDRRVKYYRNKKNMGSAWNFNRAFRLSSGKYFMWACHDDYWHRQYLADCFRALNKSKSVILAGSESDVVKQKTKELMFQDKGVSTVGLSPQERFIFFRSMINKVSYVGSFFYGIYRTEALSKALPLREVKATDHLLLAELCFYGEFVTLPKRLMFKRWGGESTGSKRRDPPKNIKERLFIDYAFLVREIILQKIIFKIKGITLLNRIKLAYYSLSKYILLVVKKKRFV